MFMKVYKEYYGGPEKHKSPEDLDKVYDDTKKNGLANGFYLL